MTTTLNNAEKGQGQAPRRALSMEVADGVKNPEQFSMQKRPWRPRITPFPHILAQEYRGNGSKEKPFIITWLPDDPENPQTYSTAYKWTVTMISAIVTLAVALASSAYSGAVASIRTDFNINNEEVLILGVSLFVLGFALGPLIWAPLSEVFGRRPILVFSYTMFTLWNAVAAASPNMAALIIFRFLAGAFGSSPLANAGGTISDMFSANMRGLATALFAAAPFLGPALGPITGGFLGEAAGWRWVQGFLGIFTGVLTLVSFMAVPETYAPALLRQRAARLSKVTGKYYRAPMDAEKELDIRRVFLTQLSMPWKLLFQEPIVMAISIYMAIVYGTLYMLFAAFPIVFQQTRGWSPGIGGLAFLGLLVGMMMGVSWTIFITNPRYIKTANAAPGGRAPPETRLIPSLLGAPLLVIGLAWFAGSCGPDTHWIVPILAGVPFGLGMLLVFLSLMNYLVDVYTVFAASVLAGNSVLRSLFGTAFPLFTTPMYRNLGIHWASAVPGFLALACLPFPYLFYKYGAGLRAKCKWTVRADKMLAAMMAGGQAVQKKEAPSQQAENDENLEAVLDAPVEEDVLYEVDRSQENAEKRVHRNVSTSGSSQQDTLAEEEVHRANKDSHSALKK